MASGIVIYYRVICVLCLFMGLYNYSQSSALQASLCDPDPSETLEQGTSLGTMPFFLAIFYAAIAVFSLIVFLLASLFSSKQPKDFEKMNFFLRCFGRLIRLLPPFITIIHLLAFFVNAFLYSQASGLECPNENYPVGTAVALTYVNFGEWALVHLFFPCIRRRIHILNFMYEPYDEDKNPIFLWCCYYIGPQRMEKGNSLQGISTINVCVRQNLWFDLQVNPWICFQNLMFILSFYPGQARY
eukprot:TRINITY_DN7575_c0_g1_i4.p1 TRINITY_DN7575_c0_g1~~TRINITY_DN7575_c0_g1_i4.p1  ORF type:complete len:243 (-),score=-2.85 TRINITY_DN7575_c0_g1_i4:114-842(-)